ncbi:DsbA family protein [Marinactinospora thermotolerans]|uniref:DsbA family protein n=1 Tax=Marinactinospora thermotolerans TaxID=531310 RepID=UPI003D92DBA6
MPTWPADFWFDPSCPYTWITSRWLVEVTRVRPVKIVWRVMSLSVLNEGRDDDPEGDPEGYLWVPARICAAVRTEYGHERWGASTRRCGRLRTPATTGSAICTGPWTRPDCPGSSPVGVGTAYDPALRASHEEGVTLLGGRSGTPITAATSPEGERTVFFGPILSRVPRGEDAARLWDGTLLMAATAGFHRLKGLPREDPDIAGTG